MLSAVGGGRYVLAINRNYRRVDQLSGGAAGGSCRRRWEKRLYWFKAICSGVVLSAVSPGKQGACIVGFVRGRVFFLADIKGGIGSSRPLTRGNAEGWVIGTLVCACVCVE